MSWRGEIPGDQALAARLERLIKQQEQILSRQRWTGPPLTAYDNSEYTSTSPWSEQSMVTLTLPEGRWLLLAYLSGRYTRTTTLASAGIELEGRIIGNTLGQIAEVRNTLVYYDSFPYSWFMTLYLDETVELTSSEVFTLEGEADAFVGTVQTTLLNGRLSAVRA